MEEHWFSWFSWKIKLCLDFLLLMVFPRTIKVVPWFIVVLSCFFLKNSWLVLGCSWLFYWSYQNIKEQSGLTEENKKQQQLWEQLDFSRKPRKPVFLHCFFGRKQRKPTTTKFLSRTSRLCSSVLSWTALLRWKVRQAHAGSTRRSACISAEKGLEAPSLRQRQLTNRYQGFILKRNGFVFHDQDITTIVFKENVINKKTIKLC